jgi:hypothetical protein
MQSNEEKKMQPGVINPFSEGFVPMWIEWKEYRWEQHKFKYKGTRSEQAALMWLNDESCQDEKEAIEIIKYCMANGWKGFFKRKINGNGGQQSSTESREKLVDVLSRRNYERG